jgi:hypothetical protein
MRMETIFTEELEMSLEICILRYHQHVKLQRNATTSIYCAFDILQSKISKANMLRHLETQKEYVCYYSGF